MSSNGFVVHLVVARRSRGIFRQSDNLRHLGFSSYSDSFFLGSNVFKFLRFSSVFFCFFITAAHVLLSGMFLLLVCLKAFRNCFMLVIPSSVFPSLNFSWLSGNHTIADFFFCRASCISCSSP